MQAYADQACVVTENADGSLTIQQPPSVFGPFAVQPLSPQYQLYIGSDGIAGNVNLIWSSSQGVSQVLHYVDQNGNTINLTGYSADLRAEPMGGGPVALELTGGNGITVGSSLTLTVAPGALSALVGQSLDYDFLIRSGGVSTRLLRGLILVSA